MRWAYILFVAAHDRLTVGVVGRMQVKSQLDKLKDEIEAVLGRGSVTAEAADTDGGGRPTPRRGGEDVGDPYYP